MTPLNPDSGARIARGARLARARTLRRRVISGAVALFVAAWLLIALVLVSGHDPALSRQTASVAASGSTPATVSSSSNSGSGTVSSSSSQSSGSSSSSSSSSSGSGAVTTRSS